MGRRPGLVVMEIIWENFAMAFAQIGFPATTNKNKKHNDLRSGPNDMIVIYIYGYVGENIDARVSSRAACLGGPQVREGRKALTGGAERRSECSMGLRLEVCIWPH